LVHRSWDFLCEEEIKEELDLCCTYTPLSHQRKVYLSQLDTQAHRVPSSPYSDRLQRQCCERLFDCLADLTQLSAVTKPAEKTQKITGAYLDGQLWVSRVVYIIQNLEQDSKHVELRSKLDQDNRKILERACGTVAWLRNVRPRFRAPGIVL
jgi:hypothetical protein